MLVESPRQAYPGRERYVASPESRKPLAADPEIAYVLCLLALEFRDRRDGLIEHQRHPATTFRIDAHRHGFRVEIAGLLPPHLALAPVRRKQQSPTIATGEFLVDRKSVV